MDMHNKTNRAFVGGESTDSLSQGESVLERPTSSGKELEKPSKERGPDRGPEREHLG